MANTVDTASGPPGANPRALSDATTPQPIPIAPPARPPAPLPEPPNDERSPRPLAVRYVKATPPVPTTITRPGKTQASRDIIVQGRIVGTMYRGKAVHHYRVEGADGVLYLCPPHWLPANPVTAAADATWNAYLMKAIAGLCDEHEARFGRGTPVPEGVA